MNKSANRILDAALALNLLALPVFSAVIWAGWLDRLSSGGQVIADRAILALWLYGGISAFLIALFRFRPHWAKLTLVGISVLVLLVGLELSGRFLLIPGLTMPMQGRPSARLHHVMPAQETMYQGRFEDVHVWVETNEDGLRTPYGRDAFLSHRTRIAILGDSFTFGFGVSGNSSYPSRLEQILRSEHPELDIAVLNAGNTSYSPIIQSRQMEQLISKYRPQIVLMMIDLTDIGDDYKYRQALRRDEGGEYFDVSSDSDHEYRGVVHRLVWTPLSEGLRYPFQVLATRLVAFGLVDSTSVDEPDDYYRFELSIGDVVEQNRFFIYRHPLALTRPHFDFMLANIEAAAASAERHGASFVLFVPPRFQHWNPEEAPENWESRSYALDEPYGFEYVRYFDEVRRRVAFPVVDLLPDFKRTERFPLVFREDPHWNAEGHGFVAETLAGHLEELRLLERMPILN